MRIVGVTVDEFVSIVTEVSPRYGGNLIVHKDAHNVARRTVQGRLSVVSSRGEGARTSASGRRMPAACWHAYRDVLVLLFERYPRARVRTGLAAYNGRTGFYDAYPATAYRNIGSEWYPRYMPDLCECSNEIQARVTMPEREPESQPEPIPRPIPQPREPVDFEPSADIVADIDRLLADVAAEGWTNPFTDADSPARRLT